MRRSLKAGQSSRRSKGALCEASPGSTQSWPRLAGGLRRLARVGQAGRPRLHPWSVFMARDRRCGFGIWRDCARTQRRAWGDRRRCLRQTPKCCGKASRVGGQGRRGLARRGRRLAAFCRAEDGRCQLVSLSPAMPTRMQAIQASRVTETGSAKSTMPSRAVPTAPMPVQTA